MACIVSGNEMTLTGDVGDYWSSDSFTSGEVFTALAQVEDDAGLVVYLNSGGGIATEGAAIHALFSRRSGTTDIVVDGIAASAASLIAMAGDTVTMSAGAVMMIHDPTAFTVGNSDTHSKSIEGLEALATAYARVYAAKSGKSAAECRAIMKAEKWLSPDDAVAEGFADETSDDQARPVAAFDYRAYAHAPQRLQALASKKKWSRPGRDDSKGNTMTTTRKDDGPAAMAAATARIKAIMQAPEATGRKELAEHLAFDTALDTEAAVAIMKVAPASVAGDEEDFSPEAYARARMTNYGGLAQPRPVNGGRNDIVAAMKQRHGVK